MLVDPVGDSVLGVVRHDEVLESQRLAAGSWLRKPDSLLDDIANIARFLVVCSVERQSIEGVLFLQDNRADTTGHRGGRKTGEMKHVGRFTTTAIVCYRN